MLCNDNCKDFTSLADYLNTSVTETELIAVFDKFQPSRYTGLKADILLDKLRKELL